MTVTSQNMSNLCPPGLVLPVTRANSPSARSRKADNNHSQPPQMAQFRSPQRRRHRRRHGYEAYSRQVIGSDQCVYKRQDANPRDLMGPEIAASWLSCTPNMIWKFCSPAGKKSGVLFVCFYTADRLEDRYRRHEFALFHIPDARAEAQQRGNANADIGE